MARSPSSTTRPAGPAVPRLVWVVGIVAVAAAMAGCVADDDLGAQQSGEATPAERFDRNLPSDLSMEGAEVIRRDDDVVTFRWRKPAPTVAAGNAAQGGSATLETSFDVPAGRFLALNVSAEVLGDEDTASWTMTLRDGDGTVRCSEAVGRQAPSPLDVGSHTLHSGDCRIDPLQPAQDRQRWTLTATFERNPAPDATLEAHLTVRSVRPGVLHEVAEVKAFSTEADDGTPLRGHVYVPDGAGPHPTILQYTPYVNAAGSFVTGGTGDRATEEGNRTSLPFWLGRFLERGYAIALVNVRGTGISGGCNSWLNPQVDGPDAANVINALANRSWSDGTVGMVGGSWHGYTQYAALLEQPEPLKAVTPVSSVLESWNLWTRYGAPYGAPTPAFYAAFTAITEVGPGDEPRHLRCPRYAEDVKAFTQLTTHGDETEYWKKRQAFDILEQNEIPMLVTNGMDTTGEGHILQFKGLWPVLNEESRLMVGQWPHAYPYSTPVEGDWWDLAIRWMDHHLRGMGPTPASGVVDYQDRQGQWHRAQAWPPAHDDARLHLGDGSLVRDGSEAGAATQSFQAQDRGPKPNACTGTKALYVSPPLAEDVRLAGSFQANVTVTSTAPNSNLGVYVWAVDEVAPCPAPESQASSSAYEVEVSRALSDLRHRGHLEQGEPFPVGTPTIMSMRSNPFATRAEAGERLVVGVTGGSASLSPEDPDPLLRVQTGPDVEGWIDLPVVDGDLAFQGTSSSSAGGGGP